MEKTDFLLDAIEHPERYSDDEIKQITNDPELTAIYRILCAARSENFSAPSLTDEQIDTEWRKFCESLEDANKLRIKSPDNVNAVRKSFVSLLHRKGVAAAAIILCSFTLLAIGYSIGVNRLPLNTENIDKITAPVVTSHTPEASSAIASETPDSLPGTIIYDNKSLYEILTDLSSYYGVKLRFDSDNAKHTHLFFKWEDSMTIEEVTNHLNTFNRIDLSLHKDTLVSK